MANIIVIETGDSIAVNFGDYYGLSTQVDSKESSYLRQNISSIHNCVTHVLIKMRDTQEWKVGIAQGPDNFVIDLINGVAPVSIDDLFAKLAALQQ